MQRKSPTHLSMRRPMPMSTERAIGVLSILGAVQAEAADAVPAVSWLPVSKSRVYHGLPRTPAPGLACFETADAFYIPFQAVSGVQRPGPEVRIYAFE